MTPAVHPGPKGPWMHCTALFKPYFSTIFLVTAHHRAVRPTNKVQLLAEANPGPKGPTDKVQLWSETGKIWPEGPPKGSSNK